MALHITISADRFMELMKAAFVDGYEDGQHPDATPDGYDWEESVAKDMAVASLERVRAGGRA